MIGYYLVFALGVTVGVFAALILIRRADGSCRRIEIWRAQDGTPVVRGSDGPEPDAGRESE